MNEAEFISGKTEFSDFLIRNNGLDAAGFQEWIFYPGMLFESSDKWWGDGGRRDRAHEGIDICFYRDKADQCFRLDESTRIPVMYDGEIIKVADDYIGRSIYVSHKIYAKNRRQLYTIYSHTQPYSSVVAGRRVSAGDIIATIENAGKKKVKMLSHLHLSMAWVPRPFACENLSWQTMNDPRMVTLCNPLEVIFCKYSTIPFNPDFAVGAVAKDIPVK